MKIAILGSGPAGLFAAHALTDAGYDFRIFSMGKKSHLNGAQYLHRPIPGLSAPADQSKVSYQLRGTVDEYRLKVYGPRPVTVSVETLIGEHTAWDIRTAYDTAWALYSSAITAGFVTSRQAWELVDEYDLVISTIPATSLCADRYFHQFPSSSVRVAGDAPGLGIRCPIEVDEGTIVCNGLASPSWYRAANVFGHRTVEWPSHDVFHDAALIRKPISTNCDCGGKKVLRLGRFGTWDKKELAHMAYYKTKEYLDVRL